MIVDDDPALSSIEGLVRKGETLTFGWLKKNFGSVQISQDVWRSLNRGRAILSTVNQLDQYLFSYGPMVQSQWKHASNILRIRVGEEKTRIVDYGCGQGLAGLLLHDYLGPRFMSDVESVVAIEPSAVAIRRAEAVYRALAPKAAISVVNKAFDKLVYGDFAGSNIPTTHLFSNVLDIDGYDHVALLGKALNPGKHTIIAIGHDRTAYGYSKGMTRVKEAIEGGSVYPGVTVLASGLEPFTCENRGEPAVLWLCTLEVNDE